MNEEDLHARHRCPVSPAAGTGALPALSSERQDAGAAQEDGELRPEAAPADGRLGRRDPDSLLCRFDERGLLGLALFGWAWDCSAAHPATAAQRWQAPAAAAALRILPEFDLRVGIVQAQCAAPAQKLAA